MAGEGGGVRGCRRGVQPRFIPRRGAVLRAVLTSLLQLFISLSVASAARARVLPEAPLAAATSASGEEEIIWAFE
ncbi:hypothetical protein J5N97_009480 [Dioscorea zingiberensis]|uniref:Uncharacterized protein n=1 Tax=Dioscorea zingiberensis TaxID=325984 RepID=A0A9D5HLI5_9LILI|nr:hypothetical protein J5N97_009480 [Dioscorea zingiberensis]